MLAAIFVLPLTALVVIWLMQAIDWLQAKCKISDDDMNAAALVFLLSSRHRDRC